MKRIAILLVLALLFTHEVVQAKALSLSAEKNSAELDFPNSITFTTELQSTSNIARVKLHYGTTQDACGKVSSVAFPDITPGKKEAADWMWDMRQSGGEPPGATIWWQWEVIDDQGVSQLTERKEILWIDDIHDWQELDEGMIRLHHYYSNPNYGVQLKDAAVAALNRLKQDIGMTTAKPIDLYIYSSNTDMTDAVFYEPGWTGGLGYAEYNILIIGIDPYNIEWGKSTEAHELTHILAGDYTFSCFGDTPTWLSEGLAVYGEGGPTSDEVSMFDRNKQDDTLLSFAVLSGGFSEDPDQADLSYSQSYYMVNYLIETYGKEKILGLLDSIRSGGTLDDSLQAIYSFDLVGFENEWRASLGLSPAETTNTEVTPVPTIIPTIIPIQGAQSQVAVTPKPTLSANGSVPADSDNDAAPQTSSDDLFQQIKDNLFKLLPWVIGLGLLLFGLIALVIVLALRKKGDHQ